MDVFFTFLIALFFSFIGSIPPGTLNLSMIQIGLESRMDIAWRFALATALIEYPYAWLAIEFESLISENPAITNHLQLITAIVMILLGGYNLWAAQKPGRTSQKFNASGFRRGIILSILNPLALPFWIALTAYLKSVGWIDLSSTLEIHSYLIGVSLGSLTLMISLAYLAKKLMSHYQENSMLKKIPGVTLIALGLYALVAYWL